MGKYIINLRDTTDRIICVGVKDRESYASGVSVSCLMPYTEPDLEKVRKEAYQQGYEQGYKDGYNEPGKGKIQVGDEVNAPFGKAIVVNINSVAEKIWLVYADGHGGFEYFKDAPTKTGRHFPEIAEVLQKMKETDNG